MRRTTAVAALAALLPLATSRAVASAESVAKPQACVGLLDRDRAVSCALVQSPEVREQRARLEAIAGRRITAGLWLPGNPVVAATLSQRRRPRPEEARVLNWNVTLSQQLELAGQRGKRLDVVDAEAAAQVCRVAVVEQEVAATAASAWLEAVAAQELAAFAGQLTETARALASAIEGRAREALVAGIEADVARAETIRIGTLRFDADRRVADARARLAVTLEIDPSALQLPAGLPAPPEEIPGTDRLRMEEQALRLRGEIAAAEMERQMLERRVALLRRERVPAVTVSAFAERGEINDRILGVGLSIPLPLPAPVGRSRAGEIAEALAEIRAAEGSLELTRRRVRLDVARAITSYQARRKSAALFEPGLLERARVEVAALRESLVAKQLSVREALAWQRSLIELLQADIDARLGLALADIELRRATGLPLVTSAGGSP